MDTRQVSDIGFRIFLANVDKQIADITGIDGLSHLDLPDTVPTLEAYTSGITARAVAKSLLADAGWYLK